MLVALLCAAPVFACDHGDTVQTITVRKAFEAAGIVVIAEGLANRPGGFAYLRLESGRVILVSTIGRDHAKAMHEQMCDEHARHWWEFNTTEGNQVP